MNCVVQIIEGENPVYEISQKTWQAFCRRTGTDYRILRAPSDYGLEIPDIYWAKWGALRHLFEDLKTAGQRYERVVAVDSDTFCLWTCDTEFIGKRGDLIGAVLELEINTYWMLKDIHSASAILGPPSFAVDQCVNAGLIVLDDTHVDFLDELLSYRHAGNKGGFVEQSVINYLLHKRGHQLLPFRYNVTWPTVRQIMIDGSYVREASVIHCTGRDKGWMMRLWYRHHQQY